eukprot:TRINITY_DN12329_c0_g1_i1.p1 TRINITY_DN12329_c0_g1~~TRINITY_DN12329_c0_g1_i1.p1  ORF type:complete len:840 (+),score=156.26 TRINITY_DN12329_c0_g1_i1:60-2522(+)
MAVLIGVRGVICALAVFGSGAVKRSKTKPKVPELAFPQERLHAWVAEEFPDPRSNPRGCSRKRQTRDVLFCDPAGLVESSPHSEINIVINALDAFDESAGARFFDGTFGVSLGVAVVPETTTTLSEFAEGLAKRWGLDGARGLLFVVRADGPASFAAAGGLARTLGTDAASQSGQYVRALVDDFQFARAIYTLVQNAALTLGGSIAYDSERAGWKIKQRKLVKFKGQYQKIGIWENSCGERRCLELMLDNVRQLSDRYEAYYHEAMVFPAMNTLGDRAKRALVLGGGDGGIASHILKFSSISHVVVAELDEEVVNISKAYFPAVAASYSDPRCTLLLGDAIKWVSEGGSGEIFDLIVVDFTDEPVEGAWSETFFRNLKAMLNGDGILVQNMGTIMVSDIKDVFLKHQTVFERVHPISMITPDYLSPYLLTISSDTMDPVEGIDLDYWERQNIVPKYYSPALQQGFFVLPANVAEFFQMGVTLEPRVPLPATEKMIPGAHADAIDDDETTTLKTETPYNYVKINRITNCEGEGEHCFTLAVNSDRVGDSSSFYVHEVVAYPAMNILGTKAKKILILGGGTFILAKYLLEFPSVQKLVVVDIDAKLVDYAAGEKSPFVSLRNARNDRRVQFITADAFVWLASGQTDSEFDAIFVDLQDVHWLSPSSSTRVPRSFDFYAAVRKLVAPGGLVVQEIGSVATLKRTSQLTALHRATFASTHILNFARLDDSLENWVGSNNFANDGILRRPPRLLAISSVDELVDPVAAVDWSTWRSLNLQPQYYHATLHGTLFVLPAEVQRHLNAPPPASLLPKRKTIGAAKEEL